MIKPPEVTHFEELILLAKDTRIWQHYAIDCSDTQKMTIILNSALTERENGKQYPFVIIDQNSNKIIGSTRFLDIKSEHKKLEIGWTWLHPSFWSTNSNMECKTFLLTYCFEELFTCRVQFKTDENNIRSRKAIEKIGGRFEGTIHNDMIRDNGTHRNFSYYSIIDSEWLKVKEQLLKLLKSQ